MCSYRYVKKIIFLIIIGGRNHSLKVSLVFVFRGLPYHFSRFDIGKLVSNTHEEIDGYFKKFQLSFIEKFDLNGISCYFYVLLKTAEH